jgi:uncharacterized protein
MSRAIWLAAGITAIVVAALPAGAAAHVTVQPEEATTQAFVVENVRVPNEQDNASTSKVAVQFPPGFAEVSFQPVPGWKASVKKSKLAEPITTDEGDKLTEQVSEVTWSGGKIGPGEFQDFPMSLQMPEKPTTLTFKATQTYDNGDIVRWIGPPDAEEPAPQVKVVAAESGTSNAASTSTSSSSSDEDSDTLGIIALIVGGLALIAAIAALVMRRRTART